MYTLRNILLVAVLSLIMSLLGAVMPVHAQQVALSLTPPLIETVIKPGKSIVIAYTIANGGDPLIMSTNISRFKPVGIDGGVELENTKDGPIRFNLENSDIQLGKAFFVKNGKGQQLLLKIRVPEGTPDGDYYYTFYAQNELGRLPEGQPSALTQARIGSHILITVTQSGVIDVNGGIGDFHINPRYTLKLFGRTYRIVESTDVIPVDLIVQNTGHTLAKPQGTITLRGSFGEKAEYTLIPQNILSMSSRRIHASPSAELRLRDGGARTDASLHINGFFVGKYILGANVDFGDKTQADSATTVFFAIPYKLISAFILVCGLSIIVLKKYRQV